MDNESKQWKKGSPMGIVNRLLKTAAMLQAVNVFPQSTYRANRPLFRRSKNYFRIKFTEGLYRCTVHFVVKVTHQQMHTHTHTHTHTYVVFNNLKFTLKHLKRSYMFRSYDHPQGAYFVSCYSYSLKLFSKEQIMLLEDDRMIETCRSVLSVLM